MATTSDNLYSTLGIPDYATAESIRKAYRKLVLRFHPDRVQNEAHRKVSTAEFLKIQEAYEELIDPVKKSKHDKRLRAAELRLQFEEQQRRERARREQEREEREKRAREKWQQEQLEREAMDEEQRQEQIRLARVMQEWKRRDQSNKDFESGARKKVPTHSAEREHHSPRVTEDARANLDLDDFDDSVSRPRRERPSHTPLGFDQKAVPRRRPHVQPVVAPAYNPTPAYPAYHQQQPGHSYGYGSWVPHPQVLYSPPPTSPPQVVFAPPSNPAPYMYANPPVYTSGRPEAAVRRVSTVPPPGIQRRVSQRQVPRMTRDELFHNEEDDNQFRHEPTHQYVDEQPKQRRRSFSYKETTSREHAYPPTARRRQDLPPSSYRSPEPRHNQAGYESEKDERRKTQIRTHSRDKHRRVSSTQSFAADAADAASPSPSPPPPKPRPKARRSISTTYKITITTSPDGSPKVDRRKGQ